MDEIKNCYYCRSDDITLDCKVNIKNKTSCYASITCNSCHACKSVYGVDHSREEVISAWNNEVGFRGKRKDG
jgi:hypothetical protein